MWLWILDWPLLASPHSFKLSLCSSGRDLLSISDPIWLVNFLTLPVHDPHLTSQPLDPIWPHLTSLNLLTLCNFPWPHLTYFCPPNWLVFTWPARLTRQAQRCSGHMTPWMPWPMYARPRGSGSTLMPPGVAAPSSPPNTSISSKEYTGKAYLRKGIP